MMMGFNNFNLLMLKYGFLSLEVLVIESLLLPFLSCFFAFSLIFSLSKTVSLSL
jgi:hypothetical protein